ncbi:MAG: hypothetical protein WCT37_00600 [Patescibacteria group bacterium]|jgi:hypothetical protein
MPKSPLKILIFLQGTLIMHATAAGKTQGEIVEQVKNQEPSVREFAFYEPIGRAVGKLYAWLGQGAKISYLSALTENKKARGDEVVGKDGLEVEAALLQRLGFPAGEIYHRENGESYAAVVARIKPTPNILIEDDCLSIGGAPEMTYPVLNPALKRKIKSIVVPEFLGIDHLPDDLAAL